VLIGVLVVREVVQALVSLKPRELYHNRASYYVAVLIGVLVVREVEQALVSLKRYLASLEN
jgi:hypothetical protein